MSDSNFNITSKISNNVTVTSNQLRNTTKSNQVNSKPFKGSNKNITSNELVKEARNTTEAAIVHLRNATNSNQVNSQPFEGRNNSTTPNVLDLKAHNTTEFIDKLL